MTTSPTPVRPAATAAAATAYAATAYVLSWVAGLVLAPAAPGHDAPASEVGAFYAGHGAAVVASALLVHGTAGLALAVLAAGIARSTAVRGGLRRAVLGTGWVAAGLSLVQFGLAVVAVAGRPADTTSRALLLGIDRVDVLKIALLAAFTAVATVAAARAGLAPRWLQAGTVALVPLLLVGSGALVGVAVLLPVLEVSLLLLLGWAAAVGWLVARSTPTRYRPLPAA